MNPIKIALTFLIVGWLMNMPAILQAQESPGFDFKSVYMLVTNLFGDQPFTATAEIESHGTNSSLTASVGFCADGEKFRSYSDMANLKSDMFTADAAAVFKQHGVDRTIMINRLDKNVKFLIYPGLRAYIREPGSLLPDAETAPIKIVKTIQGQETIYGHPCNKLGIVFIQEDSTNLFGTVWQALDLENFSVQIKLVSVGNSTQIHFENVKLGRLDPDLVEVPAGYTRYDNLHEMLYGKTAPQKIPETKAQADARVLKWHQEQADKGDPYCEYRMGLHYRDGDGVPKDLDKAREWLQKSADQGDTDAATELAKLFPKPDLQPPPSETPEAKISDVTILSAEFGTGKQVVDVTVRVVELLYTKPDGFTVNPKSLGADPLPGKKKRLVVKYDYQGTNHVLVVQAGKYLGKEALVKNTFK